MKRLRAGVLVLSTALVIAAGCSTTHVTNSWTTPGIQTEERPKKTLVVALFPNEASRRTLEDHLSARLGQEGVTAVPGNRYFGDTSQINRDTLQQLANKEGFDSVVMARFMGIKYDYHYAGGTYWGLGMGFGGGYYGYAPYFGYGGGWYYPDYYYPEEQAVVQTSLFDAKENGKLLWSATSETVDPRDSVGEMGAIADKVVKRMEKDAVL